MAKAATKKNPKTSKVSTPKKAPAAKSSRVTPAKLIKAAKAPVAKKVMAKASVPSKKTRAARAPVIAKDELRNQIEKLTAANTTLKTKGRETAKALKAAEARIAVLEHQVNQSDTKAVIEEKPIQAVKLPRMRPTPKTGALPAPETGGGEDTEGPPDSETV